MALITSSWDVRGGGLAIYIMITLLSSSMSYIRGHIVRFKFSAHWLWKNLNEDISLPYDVANDSVVSEFRKVTVRMIIINLWAEHWGFLSGDVCCNNSSRLGDSVVLEGSNICVDEVAGVEALTTVAGVIEVGIIGMNETNFQNRQYKVINNIQSLRIARITVNGFRSLESSDQSVNVGVHDGKLSVGDISSGNHCLQSGERTASATDPAMAALDVLRRWKNEFQQSGGMKGARHFWMCIQIMFGAKYNGQQFSNSG
ncbi:hypothetical protein IW261DRAFT_1424485 [Armillaria novae-zelandiae]|uniref:Uncharacterized protein n=1 Tax=Armillaria novae-zelandiae TaxID=153914 RepID=A0AA39NUW4_9AGAR|nr:hypothetical protein IW261DRAFT_1424485 [Armillaria novae-zelandiae]